MVLEGPKLAYIDKIEESILSQEFVSHNFCWVIRSVINNGLSNIPPLVNRLELLSVVFVS